MLLWAKPFGYPSGIICDQDGSFQGSFFEDASRYGIFVRMVHTEAHWQMSDGERHGKAWRDVTVRTVDEAQAIVLDQMQEAGCCGCYAKNMIIRRCGVSPMMAVFAKVPRLPGSLMSSDAASPLLHVGSQDEASAMTVQ